MRGAQLFWSDDYAPQQLAGHALWTSRQGVAETTNSPNGPRYDGATKFFVRSARNARSADRRSWKFSQMRRRDDEREGREQRAGPLHQVRGISDRSRNGGVIAIRRGHKRRNQSNAERCKDVDRAAQRDEQE